MMSELIELGWQAFPKGEALHHWRTRSHSKVAMSACGYLLQKTELKKRDVLPSCSRCREWLSLYAIDDSAPPQK